MGLPRKQDLLGVYGMTQVEIFAGFSPAGAGAPTNVLGIGSNAGVGAFITSIARTGVGTFLITFNVDFRPKDLMGFGVEYAHDAANPGLASIAFGAYTFTPGVAGTLTMYTLVSSVKADIAANAASKVRFTMRFKLSPVKDITGL